MDRRHTFGDHFLTSMTDQDATEAEGTVVLVDSQIVDVARGIGLDLVGHIADNRAADIEDQARVIGSHKSTRTGVGSREGQLVECLDDLVVLIEQ